MREPDAARSLDWPNERAAESGRPDRSRRANRTTFGVSRRGGRPRALLALCPQGEPHRGHGDGYAGRRPVRQGVGTQPGSRTLSRLPGVQGDLGKPRWRRRVAGRPSGPARLLDLNRPPSYASAMEDPEPAQHTLVLVRHAKSSWESDVDDHDRPLSGRGRRDAVAIGQELARRGAVFLGCPDPTNVAAGGRWRCASLRGPLPTRDLPRVGARTDVDHPRAARYGVHGFGPRPRTRHS